MAQPPGRPLTSSDQQENRPEDEEADRDPRTDQQERETAFTRGERAPVHRPLERDTERGPGGGDDDYSRYGLTGDDPHDEPGDEREREAGGLPRSRRESRTRCLRYHTSQ